MKTRPLLLIFASLAALSCRNLPSAPERALEPSFKIVDIVILQNSLVNTRLKVRMHIENPNAFPLELSAFSYELRSNGSYWADGKEKQIRTVPPKSAALADLVLVMNFTSQSRALLDKVIGQSLVEYHFFGSAQINAVKPYNCEHELPAEPFTAYFDLQGVSEVRQ
ncbi:MAG: hypothetical protein LBJ31_01010 [Treponema sp.]|jgi:LEA14-like dessication related protein|nr:hypothetical protein [Treponema sp.]